MCPGFRAVSLLGRRRDRGQRVSPPAIIRGNSPLDTGDTSLASVRVGVLQVVRYWPQASMTAARRARRSERA